MIKGITETRNYGESTFKFYLPVVKKKFNFFHYFYFRFFELTKLFLNVMEQRKFFKRAFLGGVTSNDDLHGNT